MSEFPDKPAVSTEPAILGTPIKGDHQGPGPRIMAADSLTGERVVNVSGEKLGEITHIMLDVQNGSIVYAVLSFGGVLGLGDKLFAVPWKALTIDVENKWFVLDIDPERLRQAPGFPKDNWPSMADPQFTARVHAYYGPVAASRRPFI